MLTIAVAIAMLAAGPVSKFDNNRPSADYLTLTKLEDVERCLIDLDGPGLPQVFRQPDRPDDVMLLWTAKGPLSAPVMHRVDLHRTNNGTSIKAWIIQKWIMTCAPKA